MSAARSALMSRISGWPNNRLYSRLNWLALSSDFKGRSRGVTIPSRPLFATPQKNAQQKSCNSLHRRGPARFLDVAKPFDTALNAVTKHLKVLERAGLIERQKRGREVLISLQGEPLRRVAAWVHDYERFWGERLDQFEQHFKGIKKKET